MMSDNTGLVHRPQVTLQHVIFSQYFYMDVEKWGYLIQSKLRDARDDMRTLRLYPLADQIYRVRGDFDRIDKACSVRKPSILTDNVSSECEEMCSVMDVATLKEFRTRYATYKIQIDALYDELVLALKLIADHIVFKPVKRPKAKIGYYYVGHFPKQEVYIYKYSVVSDKGRRMVYQKHVRTAKMSDIYIDYSPETLFEYATYDPKVEEKTMGSYMLYSKVNFADYDRAVWPFASKRLTASVSKV